MATYVNNGDVNLSAGLNQTGIVKTTGAGLLAVSSAATKYSATWNGVDSRVDIGVLIKIAYFGYTASPGTITIDLERDNGGWGSVASNTFVVNGDTKYYGGWYLIKFSSSYTEVAGTNNYRIKISSNVANNLFVYYDNGSSSNIGIITVLDTTGNPGEGDDIHIVGDMSGATGNPTAKTVTIDDSVAATFIIGSDTNSDYVEAIAISNGGTLLYSHTAGADHTIRAKGHIKIYAGALLQAGTSANPIPSTRIFKLELNYSASLASTKYGLYIIDGYSSTYTGGTLSLVGATLTKIRTKLAADEAAAQTELSVDDSTGWKSGNIIAIAGTRRAAGEAEQRTLANDDEGTGHLDITAGLTYAHNGVAPTKADVALMSRNVTVTAYNTSYNTFIYAGNFTTLYLKNIEVSYIGANSSYKYGITLGNCSSTTITYCSIWKISMYGVYSTGSTIDNITITYNNIFDVTGGDGMKIVATSGSTITISNNLLIKGSYQRQGFNLEDVGITFQNNIVANFQGAGLYINENATLGTFSDYTCYCGGDGTEAYSGIRFSSNRFKATFNNITIWRQNGGGIYFGGSPVADLSFDNAVIWGTTYPNISINGVCYDIVFTNGDFASETGYTTSAYLMCNNVMVNFKFYSCSFGQVSGTKIAASYFAQMNNSMHNRSIYIYDSPVAFTTIWDSTQYFGRTTFIAFENYNNVEGRHITYFGTYNNAKIDSIADHVTGGQAAGWARGGTGIAVLLNPTVITQDLIWKFNVPCSDGVAVTVNIYVRKTAGSPTLTFSARGCGITPIVDASVSLTTDWAQYVSDAMTPDRNGFIEITLKARDNASSGDIGIDDITIS